MVLLDDNVVVPEIIPDIFSSLLNPDSRVQPQGAEQKYLGIRIAWQLWCRQPTRRQLQSHRISWVFSPFWSLI